VGLILSCEKDSIISKSLAMNYVWEPLDTDFILSNVKQKMNVLDLGANIGYYTILISKIVGNLGKVFAFEPSKENYEILTKNIRANRCFNVHSFQKAVSDLNKSGTLFLDDKNWGDHRIIDFAVSEKDQNRKSEKVDLVNLDSFIPSDISFNFIKMDIQGAEILALNGMRDIIKRSESLKMLIEFWPYALQNSGYQPQKLIEILRDYGFKLFILENRNKIPVYDDFYLITNYGPNDYTNLICEK